MKTVKGKYVEGSVDEINNLFAGLTHSGDKTMKYETVNTTTLAGLKRAEYLHTHGWKQIRVGLFSTQFEKKAA